MSLSGVEESIHDRLAELARLPQDGCIIDLGCGAGPTLAAFGRHHPNSWLVGFDRSPTSVAAARERLASHGGKVDVQCADLREPVPLVDEAADAVVSYNVLECLPDPVALIEEAHRLLKPGGWAVLAHVDFDSVMLAGAPPVLDRRVCHAFTDDQQPWMDHADGRIGRKLPGMVQASSLVLENVEPWVTCTTLLAGKAARRVENVRNAVSEAARSSHTDVTEGEVRQWYADVQRSADSGGFFFAETAIIVTARRAGAKRPVTT